METAPLRNFSQVSWGGFFYRPSNMVLRTGPSPLRLHAPAHLTLAWSIIHEKHRGTLTFDTKKDEGTTFFISLPIAGRLADHV